MCVCVCAFVFVFVFVFFEMLAGITFSVHSFWGENWFSDLKSYHKCFYTYVWWQYYQDLFWWLFHNIYKYWILMFVHLKLTMLCVTIPQEKKKPTLWYPRKNIISELVVTSENRQNFFCMAFQFFSPFPIFCLHNYLHSQNIRRGQDLGPTTWARAP